MKMCRGCGAACTVLVMDLAGVPAADRFPAADDPAGRDDAPPPLPMTLCRACGLAQLDRDDTVPDEPKGIEPQALRDQARLAVRTLSHDGWLGNGGTALEFGSPHGGTWLPLLAERGYRTSDVAGPADIVLDSFGLMHAPDQKRAFADRAAVTGPHGMLLVQFHSLATILRCGQWNSLRHGHFAYYSLSALTILLSHHGMCVRAAWQFDLYGGTVLVAAMHADAEPPATAATGPVGLLKRIRREERVAGVCDPCSVAALSHASRADTARLRAWLHGCAENGIRPYAYGASSRAVALLHLAGADPSLLAAIADASPAKHGRRLPGTGIPIIEPSELVEADPDVVLLTVPDLLPELERALPELRGRWLLGPPPRLPIGEPHR